MYSSEKIYRSLIYHMAQAVPSGVVVVEGESYGVRLDNPTPKNPSVSVTLDNMKDTGLELGSVGTRREVTYTVLAKSRMQRDALKDVIYQALLFKPIPVYSDFDLASNIPATDAVVENMCEIQSEDNILVRNIQNFDTDREQLFWVAIVFAAIVTIST